MKRKFSLISMLFTALAAIAVIVVSCQKENGPKEPTDIYEQIGKLHNEGLDYAFNYILTNQTKAGIKLTQEEARVKGLEALDLFLAKHGFAVNTTKVGTGEINDYNGEGLNEKQKEYYDELIEVIINPSLDYKNTQLAVDRVKRSIISNMSTQEAEVLLYGIAIAKHSLEYWYKNEDKWRTAGGLDVQAYRIMTKGENPEDDDNLDWKEVAKGDVSGAVGGAAAGLLAGGVGAGPGALVGGATGSLVAGVEELWDWIF